jgi:hypothetical protein
MSFENINYNSTQQKLETLKGLKNKAKVGLMTGLMAFNFNPEAHAQNRNNRDEDFYRTNNPRQRIERCLQQSNECRKQYQFLGEIPESNSEELKRFCEKVKYDFNFFGYSADQVTSAKRDNRRIECKYTGLNNNYLENYDNYDISLNGNTDLNYYCNTEYGSPQAVTLTRNDGITKEICVKYRPNSNNNIRRVFRRDFKFNQ